MRTLTGIWAYGDLNNRPITFKNTNIIINWSFYNLKLEIYGSKDDLKIITKFMEEVLNFSEWSCKVEIPIIWMYIQTKNKFIKSKKIIISEEIELFLKNEDFYKIVIFYETTIQSNPLNYDYTISNDYWIACIGGLYNVVDMKLFIENEDDSEIIESEKYTNNSIFEIKNYSYENLENYALETSKTSIDLIEKNQKWKNFKFDWNIELDIK